MKYVFATNGHLYGEFDFFASLQEGPFPVTKVDARTLQENIGSIKQHGSIVSEALGRLATLMATTEKE
jgi:hypothetical protein